MDKPVGLKVGWTVLSTSEITNPWFSLRSDKVQIAGRGDLDYHYLHHPGGVLIVPVTPAGEILLIRQYRYPVDAWCMEVPAGGMHETPDVLETARRELREETGSLCASLERIGQFFVSNSLSDERVHVVLALGAAPDGGQKFDRGEFIEVRPTPLRRALEMARQGGIEDGKSALALLMCEPRLNELFP